jgi:hypothetical protein
MNDETAGERLNLVLQSLPEEIYEPESVAEAPLVRFDAYTLRHRLSGWVRLRADRLSDLLNACESLVLTGVEFANLEDGEPARLDRAVIERGDIVAVHATGPRGDVAQRRTTEAHAVALHAGNYLLGGHLHVPPGADPLEQFGARPEMVPLTDAWIEYSAGGLRGRQSVGTIIVNRRQVDWIWSVTDEDLADGRLRPPVAAAP